MRHKKHKGSLNRSTSHRKSMFYNMSKSIIYKKIIKTSLSKAKEVRKYLEPLITLSKYHTLHNKRLVYAKLKDKIAVRILFDILGPKFKNSNGGYLQILKCGYRRGDASQLAFVKLLHKV